MDCYYKQIKIIFLIITSLSVIKAQCDVCEFTIDEAYFNESIVGYYLGGFDISTGSSNVLLFEYLINGSSSCYLSTADEFSLDLHYEIEIFSPALGFPSPESSILQVFSNLQSIHGAPCIESVFNSVGISFLSAV